MNIDKRDILATSVRNVEELKRRYDLDKEGKKTDLSDYLKGDILPISVENGGTGVASFTSGTYLMGNGTNPLQEKTTEEVASDIKQYLEVDTSNLVIKPTLLWSNASPTSTFPAQTVSLDLTDYSYVYIENCRGCASASDITACRTELFQKDTTGMMINGSYFVWLCSRQAKISDTGVVFTTGKYAYVGESGQGSGDKYCIPLKIYGVRV